MWTDGRSGWRTNSTTWAGQQSAHLPDPVGKGNVMLKRPREEEREQRLQWEIVPDAHDAEEQAAGWWAYLEDTVHFPFRTRCRAERASSPLRLNEEVEVMGLASDEHEVLVEVRWSGRALTIPLVQLEVLDADTPTRQAIEDWHYWVERGYQW